MQGDCCDSLEVGRKTAGKDGYAPASSAFSILGADIRVENETNHFAT
jgi:hypothetical protein